MQVAFKGKETALVSCAQIIFSNLRHCVKSSLCVRMDGARLGTLGSYDTGQSGASPEKHRH